MTLLSLLSRMTVAALVVLSIQQSSYALDSTGGLLAWGRSSEGQTYPIPEFPAGIQAISAGWEHSLVLLTTGSIIGWGLNSSGAAAASPGPPGLAQAGIKAISAGGEFNLALLSNGTVVAWGKSTVTTVPIGAQAGVQEISAGYAHCLALLSTGAVVTWGESYQGQGSVPNSALSGVKAISAGGAHSMALLGDGSVAAWGRDLEGQCKVPTAAQANVQAIAAGYQHSLALLANGTVVAWGLDTDGQATVPPAAKSGVRAIAAGIAHSLALLRNGTLVAWGSNQFGQATTIFLAEAGVQAISAGGYHNLALVAVSPAAPPPPKLTTVIEGRVLAWGSDLYGQATVPDSAQAGVIAIAAGGSHSLALLTSGAVVGWGYNNQNEVAVPDAAGANVQAIAASGQHSLALLNNGTVLLWGVAYDWTGNSLSTQLPSSVLAGVTAIAAGEHHALALLESGAVVAWGWDFFGRSDVPIAALSGVVGIAAGGAHSLALLANGTVLAWGNGSSTDFGQSVVPGSAKSNVQAIAAGGAHSLALLTSGKVLAWGSNSSGQIGVPLAAQSGVKAISAGDQHSLALLKNGTVVAWGSNADGQATVIFLALQGVQAIAAGASHNLIIADIVPSPPVTAPVSAPTSLGGLPPSPPMPPGGKAMIPTPAPPPPGSSGGVPIGAIIGGVIGALVFLAFVFGRAYWERRPAKPPQHSAVPVTQASHGAQHDSTATMHIGMQPKPGYAPSAPPMPGSYNRAASQGANMQPKPGYAPSAPPMPAPYNRAASQAAFGPPLMVAPNLTAGYLSPSTLRKPTGWTNPATATTASTTTATTLTSSSAADTNGTMAPYLPGEQLVTAGPAALTPQASGPASVDLTQAIQLRVLDSLMIRWQDLAVGRVLGEGGFGKVYKGVWQGLPVAIKSLTLDRLGPGAREALHQEALIMCDLRYPYIARVFGLVDESDHQALVMQLYSRGTLAAYMAEPAYEELSLQGQLRLALQVAMGMRFLHERKPPILHGDLKTSNILLSDDTKQVAIADFGLSGKLVTGTPGKVIDSGAMTVSISPPEVLSNPSTAPRTTAADVYAFAIVLLEILSGHPAYRHMRRNEVVAAVLQGRRPSIPSHVPLGVAGIITACWDQEPANRPPFAWVVASLEAVAKAASPHTTAKTGQATSTDASSYPY